MDKLQLFNSQKIRTHWDSDNELWYFSIIDIVSVLTEQIDHQGARNYWKVLKHRLLKEGNETVTNCNQLKMKAVDGKMRLTDVATTEQVLRLVQSIPSPNAEPFKQWLAQVGYERIEAIQDPEKSIDTAMQDYLNLGYSKEWINQRLKSIEIRKDLTNEWENKGLSEAKDFAILTNIITKGWSGKSVKEYKELKNLKKENLRDNMTNLELVLNMLAEATTTEISQETNPSDFEEHKKVAQQGGDVAGNARKEIEQKTGKKIVTNKNAKSLKEIK